MPVDAALLRLGDDLLGDRPQRLGLGLGGDEGFGRDQRRDRLPIMAF